MPGPAGGRGGRHRHTENQSPALLADGRPRRLFEDYAAEEQAYFRRTRIFPIMHVLAQTAASRLPSCSLAWKDDYLQDERALFGGDLWPFGLEANRHVLETFIGYCWQQGIAARQLAPEELFVPSTRELVEE